MPRGQSERNAEGYRPQIFDLHLPSHGHYAPRPVGLAHGLVEQGGDDPAVGVSWRSGKAAGESRMTNNGAGIVDEEAEPQAGAILLPASEAVVQSAMGKGRQMRILSRIGIGHMCGTSLRGPDHKTYGTRAATRRAYAA